MKRWIVLGVYSFLSILSISGLRASIPVPAGDGPAKRVRCDRPHMEDQEVYARATTDTAFKHLFDPGQPESRELLISFLNTFIPAFRGNPVTSLEARSAAVPALPREGRKQTFMDLHAQARDGTSYILEMQARRHAMFDERALFYAAAVYSRQIAEPQFQDKDWYYHLKPVIALQVLDYDTNIVRGITSEGPDVTGADKAFVKRVRAHPMKADQFMKQFLFTDGDSGQVIDYLQLLQLELPRASRIRAVLSKEKIAFSIEDWWIDILLNAPEYTLEKADELHRSGAMPEVVYQSLQRLNLRKWDPEMIKEYKEDLSDLSKYQTMIDAEKAGARAEGLQQGLQQGIEKGEQKKVFETLLEMHGRKMPKESMEVTLQLMRIPEDQIALLLGLSADEIKERIEAI